MKRARIAGVILLVAIALIARLLPGPRTIDDAYITFRYARNLLGGEGFLYNPGEHVMGTTTPLYTLLLSGAAVFFGGEQANFPMIALVVNALADALTCLLLWQIGKRLGSETAGVAAGVIWAVAPFSVTFAIGGLETSVYILLMTGTVYFYLRKNEILTGLAAAGVFLTRMDGLILLGPLGLFWLIRALQKKERLSWRVILAAGLPLALWLVFAGVYFGSPIPQSIQAKLVAYRLEPNASLMRLLQHYAVPFFEYNLLGPAAAVGMGLLLYPFLAVLGVRRALKFRTAQPCLAALPMALLYRICFAKPVNLPLVSDPASACLDFVNFPGSQLDCRVSAQLSHSQAPVGRVLAGVGLRVNHE